MNDSLDWAAPAAISEEAFCGPDLDLEGDADFLNFMATYEGSLPASFYDYREGLERKEIDFAAVSRAGASLLERTHDVRLHTLLAKLRILDRDLPGFEKHLGVIAWLLAHRWDEVHPRGEDGDFAQRLAQVGTLDDGPVVILPVQYAPLLETQRDGALSFRARMVARGEANPREKERLASAAAIDRIIEKADAEALVRTTTSVERIRAALSAIEAVTREKVGQEIGIEFKTLGPLVARIAEFMREIAIKRDPSLAPPPSETGGAAEPETAGPGSGGAVAAGAAPGAFANLGEIDAALASALGYFALSEPSSPSRLLIAQARDTLGKNLYDVMRQLAPSHADNARVFVGPEGAFTVPVSSLSNASGVEFERVETPPAPSRAAALSLIDAVASHIRRVEPSSPAPFLLERARSLASRDFLSLLRDLLPEDDLNSMKFGR